MRTRILSYLSMQLSAEPFAADVPALASTLRMTKEIREQKVAGQWEEARSKSSWDYYL
ncbi:unnamed protein product, partial [Cylicocyclus nassatus]